MITGGQFFSYLVNLGFTEVIFSLHLTSIPSFFIPYFKWLSATVPQLETKPLRLDDTQGAH
jgi:hypothetical protein